MFLSVPLSDFYLISYIFLIPPYNPFSLCSVYPTACTGLTQPVSVCFVTLHSHCQDLLFNGQFRLPEYPNFPLSNLF